MACRLFGDKKLPKPMTTYWQLGLQYHTSMKYLVEENTFEIFVNKMAVILYRPQCIMYSVKS